MSTPAGPQPEVDPAEAADALRTWAGEERARAGAFADFLETIATDGLPLPETGRRWEDVREEHLRSLNEQNSRNVA